MATISTISQAISGKALTANTLLFKAIIPQSGTLGNMTIFCTPDYNSKFQLQVVIGGSPLTDFLVNAVSGMPFHGTIGTGGLTVVQNEFILFNCHSVVLGTRLRQFSIYVEVM